MNGYLETALARVLRPLIKLMISKGIGMQALTEHLKALYVEQAERHFQLDGKRMTDSRVSLLTGLHRRDVRRLRDAAAPRAPATMGPVPRVIARWMMAPGWQDEDGQPLRLQLRGEGPQSFEQLVAAVSRDVHPRSVLDALLAEHLAEIDGDTGEVMLVGNSYVPKHEQTQTDYLGMNLGDHAVAAVENVLARYKPPFFERAAHFNKLSPGSLGELDRLARKLQLDVLQIIAEKATALQDMDAGTADAGGRFRCGAFVYVEESPPGACGGNGKEEEQ